MKNRIRTFIVIFMRNSATPYELTGSHEYMGGDQLPFSAAFSYLESAGYIDNYNF